MASASVVLDPEIFLDKLNDNSEWFKFSEAVVSTDANPQDCEIFEKILNAFLSASCANKPVGIYADFLEKVCSINRDTVKTTLQVTTPLNRQDANPSLY